MREWNDGNPFVGYAIEELARTLPNPSGGHMTGTPIPIHSRLDSDKIVNAPYEYLRALNGLADLAVEELNAGLLVRDKELVSRACRKLRSIGALAEIASESL